MTIKELIEMLKNYPEDLIVLVDGYEGYYHTLRRKFQSYVWCS